MAIITLLSDWGYTDYYLSSVKGHILKLMPEAKIIDITHNVPPFDIHVASYILSNSYHHFPDGTIHIIGLNTTASIETPHLVVKYKEHYFIGADTGIFSLLIGKDEPQEIIEIDILQDSNYFTFSERDVFVKVAIHIAEGKPIEELGETYSNIQLMSLINPIIDKDKIGGYVEYIDSYSNIITNISEEVFLNFTRNKKFKISISPMHYITKLSKSYMDVPKSKLLALINSSGKLEIAQNEGNIADILNLSIGDPINIYIN